MQYWVHQSGQTSSRAFTAEELRGPLRIGQLAPHDRLCAAGDTEWRRVEMVLSSPPSSLGKIIAQVVGTAFLLVASSLGLAFWMGSSKRPLPPTAKYVPRDSLVVVTIHAGSLLEKSGVSEHASQLNRETLRALQVPRSLHDRFKTLLQNPAQLGIDASQPLFLFLQPPPRQGGAPLIGLTLPLLGRHAFISGLRGLARGMDNREGMLFKQLANELRDRDFFQADAEVAFAINDDVLLMVCRERNWNDPREPDLEARARDILKNESGLADVNEGFLAHLQDAFRPDIGAWVDLKSLLEEAGPGGPDLPRGRYVLSGGIKFEAGAIHGKFTLGYDEEIDFSGPGVPDALLDAVPADSMLAFSQSINMTALREWFARPGQARMLRSVNQEMERSMGFAMDDLLEAFGGDWVFTTGVRRERGRARPWWILGTTLDHPGQARRLLDASDLNFALSRQGYRGVIRGDLFFIGPEDLTGDVIRPVSGEKRAVLARRYLGLFIDPRKIAQQMVDGMQPGSDDELVLDLFATARLITLTGNTAPGAQLFEARLMLDNRRDNSLQQIAWNFIRAALTQRARRRQFMEGNPMDKFTQDPVGVDEEKMLKAVEEAQRGMGLGVEESSRLFQGL